MKFIHQIVALCVALLILVSTTGFAMNAHFCGGELQNVAFFKQAEPCKEHTKQLSSCHHQNTSDAETGKKACCEDQTVINDGQELLAKSITLKVPKPDLTSIVVVASFVFAVTPTSTQYFSNSHHIPPLIERDIPVLVQSFLI